MKVSIDVINLLRLTSIRDEFSKQLWLFSN